MRSSRICEFAKEPAANPVSAAIGEAIRMPPSDIHLGIGSGTHAQQTAKVMVEIEPVLLGERPDVVVVAGDVNSTLAVALVAAKIQLAVAHVEAGLRSSDWTMPEEINRVL